MTLRRGGGDHVGKAAALSAAVPVNRREFDTRSIVVEQRPEELLEFAALGDLAGWA